MTDPVEVKVVIGAPVLTIDGSKAKATVALVPVPDSYLPPIAQIILLWGSLETELSEFIATMAAYLIRPEPKLRGIAFHQKMSLFAELVPLCFAECPKVDDLLKIVPSGVVEPQKRRNLLAHGELSFLGASHDPTVMRIVARGRHAGEDIECWFDQDSLITLQYEIADLLGRVRLVSSSPQILLPLLSSQERSTLEAVLRCNPRHRTNG